MNKKIFKISKKRCEKCNSLLLENTVTNKKECKNCEKLGENNGKQEK